MINETVNDPIFLFGAEECPTGECKREMPTSLKREYFLGKVAHDRATDGICHPPVGCYYKSIIRIEPENSRHTLMFAYRRGNGRNSYSENSGH